MRDVSDLQAAGLVIGGAVVFAVLITIIVVRLSSAFSERLQQVVTTFGWEGPSRVWWSGKIRARWRGFDVEVQRLGRQKSIPERLIMTVKTASPARLIIKRRTHGFLSKPLTWFGPPLVEPMNLADRERYWIRSDELGLAERLFSRATVAPALEPNLIASFDVVDLRPKGLRIVRAIDDGAVRKRFNRPALSFRKDLDLIETIATEEWGLAVVIVEALALRGAGQ